MCQSCFTAFRDKARVAAFRLRPTGAITSLLKQQSQIQDFPKEGAHFVWNMGQTAIRSYWVVGPTAWYRLKRTISWRCNTSSKLDINMYLWHIYDKEVQISLLCWPISTNQSIDQSINYFICRHNCRRGLSQWAHAIQRFIDYVINNPTLIINLYFRLAAHTQHKLTTM